MPIILDGNRVRDQILHNLRPRVAALAASSRPPGLAVVLVGNDPGSQIYVRNKVKACADLGIASESLTPLDSITTEELLALIEDLNQRPDIDGILVQLPLPPQVDSRRVLLAVAPHKDVDGFHPMNVGNLVAGRPGPRPCTPAGIMELLRQYQIGVAGMRTPRSPFVTHAPRICLPSAAKARSWWPLWDVRPCSRRITSGRARWSSTWG
jgi:methylenetetrahydrofolate dehydrogenase (NADP+)/methenyltetrahydrofolate cyclohydrolase